MATRTTRGLMPEVVVIPDDLVHTQVVNATRREAERAVRAYLRDKGYDPDTIRSEHFDLIGGVRVLVDPLPCYDLSDMD